MADILVLGGSGFVSEALAKYLIRRDYSIDILISKKDILKALLGGGVWLL